jgi:hypothetical protein
VSQRAVYALQSRLGCGPDEGDVAGKKKSSGAVGAHGRVMVVNRQVQPQALAFFTHNSTHPSVLSLHSFCTTPPLINVFFIES